MEAQNSEHGHIIEVSGDVPAVGTSLSGSKICGEAACGFSDAKTSSRDAMERSASMRKLLMAVVLCVIFMSVEVAGGIKANSLAILTDAAHLLSDVAAFAISLFSLWAAGWEATPRQSYGFFRIEILGALVSIQMIWLLAGILVYEAIARIVNDTGEVQGFLMFVVSAFGLVVNIAMALLLGHDHGHGHGHDHAHGGHDHGHGDHGHSHGGHDEMHSHGITITTHPHHHNHNHGGHSKHDEHHHAYKADHTEPLLKTCCEGEKQSEDGAPSKHDAHRHKHGGHSKHDERHHAYKADHTEPLLKTCCEGEKQSEDGAKQKKKWNINVQGAYLHVLGDSIQSVGVMIGGAIIWYKPEWKIIDVICTLVFSVVVLVTTIRMLRNILEVLMESTPREIDATKLEKGLCEMDEVVAIHELHIWAVTVGKVLLACHVIVKPEADADMVLDKVIDYIRREYNISHVTIQIERQ
jgi:zinc transporter 2